MNLLTEKQEKVLSFIENYHNQYGLAPSYQEIKEQFGFSSPHSATKHVQALIKKGYLKVRKGVTRNATRSIESLRPQIKKVPVIGMIAAGNPIEAIHNFETSLDLSTLGISNISGDHFALFVKGDSMINAHILEGDLVVIKKQNTIKRNEIAAVLWNGEATLKYVKKLENKILLIPANNSMQPITVYEKQTDTFEILGKVVKVVRNV